MGCTLKPLLTYDVSHVVHDTADNRTTVQITNPPDTCPDKDFTTHKGELQIQAGVGPLLKYDNVRNMPVIIVPKKEFVEYVDHPTSWGFIFLYTILGAAILFAIYKIFFADDKKRENNYKEALDLKEEFARSKYKPSQHKPASGGYTPRTGPSTVSPARFERHDAPVAAPAPTIINNNHSSNDGLMTGIILGSVLSDHGHHDTHTTEVIREREVIREAPSYTPPEPSFTSDDDDSKSTFSSDSSSSSDSDSSSSFSSDSSSSFSSDSSSFSSDSSSSFDSGGGGGFSGD